MRLLGIMFASMVLVGCPRPVSPPQPPYVADGAVTCPVGLAVSQDDLCVNSFTANNIACVTCQFTAAATVPDGGCFMPGPAIYCVKSCSDCKKHAEIPAK